LARDAIALDYTSDRYRQQVDGSSEVAQYHLRHDPEQLSRLEQIGCGSIRGQVIADIGCGAGSFLDLVKGFAARTVGVEPAAFYHSALKEKGHQVFSSCLEAQSEWRGGVDLAVSFAVLEHVPDPLAFLQEIRTLLRPGGSALISTPNADDGLLKWLGDDYARFFYREAHLWYFNGASLSTWGRQAGFASVRLVYQQQYDFSNAVGWLRDRKATGHGCLTDFAAMDLPWRQFLQSTGQANYLYAWLGTNS